MPVLHFSMRHKKASSSGAECDAIDRRHSQMRDAARERETHCADGIGLVCGQEIKVIHHVALCLHNIYLHFRNGMKHGNILCKYLRSDDRSFRLLFVILVCNMAVLSGLQQ